MILQILSILVLSQISLKPFQFTFRLWKYLPNLRSFIVQPVGYRLRESQEHSVTIELYIFISLNPSYLVNLFGNKEYKFTFKLLESPLPRGSGPKTFKNNLLCEAPIEELEK